MYAKRIVQCQHHNERVAAVNTGMAVIRPGLWSDCRMHNTDHLVRSHHHGAAGLRPGSRCHGWARNAFCGTEHGCAADLHGVLGLDVALSRKDLWIRCAEYVVATSGQLAITCLRFKPLRRIDTRGMSLETCKPMAQAAFLSVGSRSIGLCQCRSTHS